MIFGSEETGVGSPPIIVFIPTNKTNGIGFKSNCSQITTVKDPNKIIAERLSKNMLMKKVNPPKAIISFLGSPFVNFTIESETKSKNPASLVKETITLTEKMIKIASTFIISAIASK